MTHIEQLHLDAIDSEVYIAYRLYEDRVVGTDEAAKKSAEITKQIAIEFAEWLMDIKSSIAYGDETCTRLYKKSTKELFQEYLKSKENETTTNKN